MVLSLFLWIGCGETSPETLVDELRVMASVAEPPEVRPGETFQYETYFANPDEAPVTALTWVCTNFGDGCMEADGGSLSIASSQPEGAAPVWERPLSVAPSLASVVTDEGITATQLWTLVCERDICPVIDEAIGVDPQQPWPDSLRTQLANPLAWMSDLPIKGTSLAYQLLTTSSSDEPHQNPVLEINGDPPGELKRNQSFTLTFRVDGDLSEQAQVYNYMTGGGFKTPNTFVASGDAVEIEGIAPKDGDESTIWVVLVDGFGGVAVWTEEIPVE